ncbi:MAG: tRNA pseudouridine(55) synthase TruB [Candidatus Omnitrophica bacterium]|nr:tRNA pseudouridine(55) synthase TruB [Candidatus Omnitrophota bacterium]
MNGLLLIDKPSGITSHDVVDEIRRKFGIRRVGHGGTLDPAATGLLVLLLGSATRLAGALLESEKQYRATLRLGLTTDTQDAEGRALEKREVPPLSREKIEEVCLTFQGEVDQTVPAYSAVRIQGRRSYELARAGVAVPPRTRRVRIEEIKVFSIRLPEVGLEVTCSKGTYIRTLCADLGERFGCGGHLASLRRLRVGPFRVEEAAALKEVTPDHLLPADRLLSG